MDGKTEFQQALSNLKVEIIVISATTAFTPESNALAKRPHQPLLEIMHTCLLQMKTYKKFWIFAPKQAVDCRNVIGHSVTAGFPCKDLIVVRPQNLSHLSPTGCHKLLPSHGLILLGCHSLLHSHVPKLQLFKKGVKIGVHSVLDNDWVFHTKHYKQMRTVSQLISNQDI